MRRTNQSKKAFTIVELLTVMGVIALLIGLLVPALNIVRRIAKDTKQRAQFHSIEVALEIFKNDEGEYPASDFIESGTVVTGAQHLAESLVGRDLQGFDPRSKGHPALDEIATVDAYATTDPEKTESLNRRKGPYLKLENVGAFSIKQLYTNSNYGNIDPCVPLISDVFSEKQITLTNGKTVKGGTPILYFRANTANKSLESDGGGGSRTTDTTLGYTRCTYNYYDNLELVSLGRMMSSTPSSDVHPFNATANNTKHQKFYDAIVNPQITTNPDGVPYNADSFILMSAGKDGFYGTADDIYNFGD